MHDDDGKRIGHRRRVINRLRNYLLTGIIVAAPLTITVYLTASFIDLVDGLVKPWIPRSWNPENYVPFPLPGLGLVVAIATLTTLGFLTANIVGRTVIRLGEAILARMPLIRTVYSALKQIFETALSERSRTFRQAGLIEWPRKGLWALVFIATDTKGEVSHRLPSDEEIISVFLPSTPNPTTGFLLFIPKRDVLVLDMSVEDAAKLIISGGLISPDWPARSRAKAAVAANPGAPALVTADPKALDARPLVDEEADAGRG